MLRVAAPDVSDAEAGSSHTSLRDEAFGLSTRTALVRGRPCAAFGVLIAEALQWHFALKLDAGRLDAEQTRACVRVSGMINGGFIRGDRVYHVHQTLTVADVLQELPFPREAALVRISARDLR